MLCYINGGYDRCRRCDRERGYCRGCDGFEGLTRKVYDTDGWIVEVAKDEMGRREKRKSVFGTAWYQLEHASLRVGATRFQIVAWFGVVGNRKLKTVLKKMEYKCPLCGNELVRGYHVGGACIVANRGERGFHKAFLIDHLDSAGRRNCIEAEEDSRRVILSERARFVAKTSSARLAQAHALWSQIFSFETSSCMLSNTFSETGILPLVSGGMPVFSARSGFLTSALSFVPAYFFLPRAGFGFVFSCVFIWLASSDVLISTSLSANSFSQIIAFALL